MKTQLKEWILLSLLADVLKCQLEALTSDSREFASKWHSVHRVQYVF